MAGQGYRLFNTGDVLTAAQVNTYLQEQVVMVFASAAARTTALSGVLAEGMMSYLTDTDVIQYYNGTSWVTVNTDQTPLTTKGDLFTYSTQDARLAVGSNGDTLVADSAQSTGLRWTSPVGSLANPVINGGMDVWQRGTSFSLAASTGTTYVADRWATSTGANQACTISRQATGDTTNLPNIQYSLRVQRNSGQTGTGGMAVSTSLESVNTIPFAGKTVTMSFYGRKGANYSPGTFNAYIITGTGTDQNRQSGGYTGENSSISASISLTTTWQRFVVTGTIPATATEMAPYLFFDFSGTAGANDWFEVTGFQIDVGTYTALTAPTFRRSGGTLAGELAACQRYYERFTYSDNGPICQGSAYNTTTVYGVLPFQVEKRANPTITVSSSTMLKFLANNTAYTSTSGSGADLVNVKVAEIKGTFSGLTTAWAGWLRSNGSTYIEASIEL